MSVLTTALSNILDIIKYLKLETKKNLTESIFLGNRTHILHGDHSCANVDQELIHKVFVFSLGQAVSHNPRTLLEHLLEVLARVLPARVLLGGQNVHVLLDTEVVVQVDSLATDNYVDNFGR